MRMPETKSLQNEIGKAITNFLGRGMSASEKQTKRSHHVTGRESFAHDVSSSFSPAPPQFKKQFHPLFPFCIFRHIVKQQVNELEMERKCFQQSPTQLRWIPKKNRSFFHTKKGWKWFDGNDFLEKGLKRQCCHYGKDEGEMLLNGSLAWHLSFIGNSRDSSLMEFGDSWSSWSEERVRCFRVFSIRELGFYAHP